MRKPPARSRNVGASEGESVAVAKDEARLASVEALSGQGPYGSGVYVVEHEPASKRSRMATATASVQEKAKKAMNPLLEQVTLVVYGWYDSQPGTLAWVFPSVRAALRAARVLRNAVRWVVVEGKRVFDAELDVDALRRAGWILVDHA